VVCGVGVEGIDGAGLDGVQAEKTNMMSAIRMTGYDSVFLGVEYEINPFTLFICIGQKYCTFLTASAMVGE